MKQPIVNVLHFSQLNFEKELKDRN